MPRWPPPPRGAPWQDGWRDKMAAIPRWASPPSGSPWQNGTHQDGCQSKMATLPRWTPPRKLLIQDGCHSNMDAIPTWPPFQDGCHSKMDAVPTWPPLQHGPHSKMDAIPTWPPFQDGCHLDLTLSTRCFLMTSSPVAPLLQLNLRGWDLLVATPSGGAWPIGGRGLSGGGVASGAIFDLFSLIICFPVFFINFFNPFY